MSRGLRPTRGKPPKSCVALTDMPPEVACLTESDVGLLFKEGHTICAQSDYGCMIKEERRKDLL